MRKRFNTTGVCIPRKHYMVDISNKIDEIEKLVEEEFYFVINRPRQFGKTTTLNELYKRLNSKYSVIRMDFELIGEDFASEERFCETFVDYMSRFTNIDIRKASTLTELSNRIIDLTKDNEIILIIDEVDKNSNNRLFLSFLGMLRSLYLSREQDLATTFKSVILAGVYDIKNLKLKVRDNSEIRYNSPWNIAINFNVDMSFSETEIGTMLREYADENELPLNIELLSKEIYKFTAGYPFLVSRICQIIDEILLCEDKKEWTLFDIQRAVKLLLEDKNTLFDDLIKNLENNSNLYEYLYNILVSGLQITYNINNPTIDLGHMFGYLVKDKNNNTIVSNQILKEVIYNYMISKTDTRTMSRYNFKDNFINEDNTLDMENVLLRFQQFMKENYSSRDIEFLERQGVLLFLSFIKPIINGVGFDYKEVQISEERRLDIVIQYNKCKYIIETKIWHGEIAHKKGLNQLKNYLEIEGLNKGYLLIFNFNESKQYSNSEYCLDNKTIFEVIV
ncbi:AAA family ATPase [Clostridium uliginosum]|uniref:PD-(D/E)XK nuclease superfamily protein n=1 Tax=Clostridium uliginosum TaxID=119641 RepID=A0A1I1RD62_9CLOT|nr:AAA family ATPase [Clostridium uliginosum]SFD32067.1 PD-(D/E)XK nuclease superfamily protein [Clostridium uliginosum]